LRHAKQPVGGGTQTKTLTVAETFPDLPGSRAPNQF